MLNDLRGFARRMGFVLLGFLAFSIPVIARVTGTHRGAVRPVMSNRFNKTILVRLSSGFFFILLRLEGGFDFLCGSMDVS